MLLSMLAKLLPALVIDVDSPDDVLGACPSRGNLSWYALTAPAIRTLALLIREIAFVRSTWRTALQTAIDADIPESEPCKIRLPAFTINVDAKPLPSVYVKYGRRSKTIEVRGASETVNATGTTLDGHGVLQLLTVQLGVIVTVSDVLFRNGSAVGRDAHNGGAISNDGEMHLQDCAFEDNVAAAAGGAISNSGSMSISRATFTRNHAQNGGAIQSAGQQHGGATMTGTDLTFVDNHASNAGGAIQNAQSHLHLTRVSFFNHSAGDGSLGGTLYNGVRARMVLDDCDVTLSSAGSGGLVANAEVSSLMVATNSRFSHGTATIFQGGALTSKGRSDGTPGLMLSGY
jgi:predicted outer membrane repeat protein